MIDLRSIYASRITKGVLASYLNTVIGIVCNLVIIPLYIKYLGREEYGLWIAVSGITTYLGFLNFGIAQTTSNLFGRAVAVHDVQAASNILSTGFWRFVNAISIGILLMLLVAPFAPTDLLFKGSTAVKDAAKQVIVLASLAFMIEMPLAIFSICLRNIGKIQVQQAVAGGQNLARVAVAYVWLSADGGLLGLIVVLSAVNIASYWVHYILLLRNVHGLKFSRKLINNKLFGEMKPHSFYFLLLQISSAIVFSTDTLVISAMLGTEVVTSFSIAQRVTSMAVSIIATISSNFAPSFLEAYSKNKLEDLKMLYNRAIKISLVGGVIISIGLLAIGPTVIQLWVGSDSYVGYFPFAMMVILVFIQAALHPADTLLMVTNNHRIYALFGLWEAILNLGLSIYLAPLFGVGGVVMGTVIARLFGAGPFILWKSKRMVNFL